LYNIKEDFFLEQHEIKATLRKSIGNGPARVLRRQGRVPAVLYGPKTENILLSVNPKDVEQILKKVSSGSAVLNLVIENGKAVTKSVMIKELQAHPVSGKFLHIDFYEIDMERKINVSVPVVVKGQSKGVELGGLLQIIRREIEVYCLPNEIPHSIEIDVTDLDIGDSVHVDEIKLEGDVELAGDVNFTVVTVVSPKAEAAREEEEEALEEGAEEEGEEAAEGKEAPEDTEEE
jgi:large subunit ribosomal protein L25